MPKNRELNTTEKQLIIKYHNENMKNVQIATLIGCSESTVRNVVKRWKETGTLKTKTGRGRKPMLNQRDTRRLMRIVKKNRRATIGEIRSELGQCISECTLRRRLYKIGMRAMKAVRKPFISKRHSRTRLTWCRRQKGWQLAQWQQVVWSDECVIQLWQESRGVVVRRSSKERFHPDCVAPTVKHGGGSIMVWACFCWDQLGPIVVVPGTIDQHKYKNILEQHLLPFLDRLKQDGKNTVFQDDGAPCHRARSVTNWKAEKGIKVLPWPAQSPDLNPIEHLWNLLKRRIKNRIPRPTNIKQLEEYVYEEWNQLDVSTLRKLVLSLPTRIRAVIASKGFQTRY